MPEAAEPTPTEFEELETIRLVAPKPGHPSRGPWRGAVTHTARVSRRTADELEAKLERVPGIRHGVPRVYREEREMTPPHTDEPPEEADAVPVPADATLAERREIEGQREVVRGLREHAGQLQRTVDSLQREIDGLRTRRDAEVRQLRDMTEGATTHLIRVQQAVNGHLEDGLAKTFALDRLQQEERSRTLQQFAKGAVAVRQAREVLDGFMLRDSWGEMFKGARELVSAALESDLGRTAALQLQSVLAAKVGRMLNLPDMSPADALAAILITGARFRESATAVLHWAATRADRVEGQVATLVVGVLRDEVPLQALADLAPR